MTKSTSDYTPVTIPLVDVRNIDCPLSFVHCKLALEEYPAETIADIVCEAHHARQLTAALGNLPLTILSVIKVTTPAAYCQIQVRLD